MQVPLGLLVLTRPPHPRSTAWFSFGVLESVAEWPHGLLYLSLHLRLYQHHPRQHPVPAAPPPAVAAAVAAAAALLPPVWLLPAFVLAAASAVLAEPVAADVPAGVLHSVASLALRLQQRLLLHSIQ